jgi:hypothetical protein
MYRRSDSAPARAVAADIYLVGETGLGLAVKLYVG